MLGTVRSATVAKDGWARMVRVNDDDNQSVEHAYFGVSGEPVINLEDDYHRVTQRLNRAGLVFETAYFGTDGKPINVRPSFAYVHCKCKCEKISAAALGGVSARLTLISISMSVSLSA